MKTKFCRWLTALALLALSTLNSQLSTARAQGTAFTYQGQLQNNGSPTSGNYDLQFTLFGVNSGGSPVAGPLTSSAVSVSNGLFTTTLDFGANFPGADRWLEIAVRTNGGTSFATLTPRQPVTPTPYAIYSENSGAANSVIASSVSAPQLNTLGAPASGQVLTYNGSSLAWANPASGGSGWSLTGNSNTIPGVNFLGTTDNEPLEFWANGARVFRLEPLGNVVGGAGSSVDPYVSGATIAGGSYNTVSANSGNAPTIGGGTGNTVSNLYPTVSGGEGNKATANGAMVGGGYQNTASGRESTVAGGNQNTASGIGAFVGGGGYDGTTQAGNSAGGLASVVAGGMGNNAPGTYATISGGSQNYANGAGAFVGGGGYDGTTQAGNNAGGPASVVGGGLQNGAFGAYDTVPGGAYNTASGGKSFAAGFQAQALHYGSFVWADGTGGAFQSTGIDQFDVRAEGGVRFVTQGGGMTLDGYQVLTTATGGGGGGGVFTNGWSLSGNGGTDPSVNFLGTKDAAGLELRVNNSRAMRLDPIGRTGIGQFNGVETSVNVKGGWWENTVLNGSLGATIAGGGGHYLDEDIGDVSSPNTVTGDFGTVGGGNNNTASYGATVPGGYQNTASGNGSFAAGRYAHTTYNGSFIWGDGSQTFNGSGVNSFDVLSTGEVGFYSTAGATKLRIQANGYVGINTNSPSQQLEVNGEFMLVDGLGHEKAYLGGDGAGSDVQIGSLNPSITAVSCYNAATSQYMHLYCSSITIEGGADLAEPFKITAGKDEIPQGAVVVIDEQNPGHLKMSDQGYDTHVAGVVSGANGINPGIQMQQQGVLEGGKNVALTGRVYVQADTSNGAIKPGDLLTTSSTPGHAMKVTDHVRAAGAILGKAMTGLSEGKGMVLVLVTLQ